MLRGGSFRLLGGGAALKGGNARGTGDDGKPRPGGKCVGDALCHGASAGVSGANKKDLGHVGSLS